ncbi:hillarin-like [Haliotis rufescens]|uniref:hillarin-like n=1 Tax=Haliotis rufescens TaxID=6454 RepID=UPI00201E75B5|nr:hillarin-like [Haliotis rufescens]XP_048250221.1 hillarin-like [Haliotis rufescens]
MGCGSSNALTDDPDISEIEVPDSEDGYPKPKPPTSKKKDIFDAEDYKEIDQNASKIIIKDDTTYEELLTTLTKDLKTDLQKLRAIFYLVGSLNIEKQFYKGVTDPHTPRGHMKLIKLRKGWYTDFFALLCRAAGLPCVIVHGKGKSVNYEVGDKDPSDLYSDWNAVYVDGEWRLVHALWSYTGIMGYDAGRWMKIEAQGQQKREKQPASKGKQVSGIKEFWFLTDPDQFVYFCLADRQEWQLLGKPWTVDKFMDVPYFRHPYFTSSDMTLTSDHKSVLVSDGGRTVIAFEHDTECKSDITYELFFDEKRSEGTLPDSVKLPRCVLFESTEEQKKLYYRFHVVGIYKTVIYIGGKSKLPIVAFMIDCKEVSQNKNLFPINPDIGFGFGRPAKVFGLQSLSESEAIVETVKNKPCEFHFKLSEDKQLEANLRHNDLEPGKLQQCVEKETKDDKVTFKVTVPEDVDNGEFALQIYGQDSKGKVNVVNYLLTNNKGDFGSDDEKRIRKQLKEALKHEDLDELEKAIEEFEKADLSDDDDDLATAKRKLKRLRKGSDDDVDPDQLLANLKKAMGDKNLEELEKAIIECEANGLQDHEDVIKARKRLVKLYEKAAEKAMKENDVKEVERLLNRSRKSPVAPELDDSEVMMRAERYLYQQKRLQKYLSVVLELKPSTVSEIHRYNHPTVHSHDSVMATYILLGEKKADLQIWQRVQTMLRLPGRRGIIIRIKNFNVGDLSTWRAKQAKRLLDRYTVDGVRVVSAGAAAFYVWSSNIVVEALTPPKEEDEDEDEDDE